MDTQAIKRVNGIRIHTEEDFAGMRRAGRLAAECLDMIVPHVQPGAVTEELDALIREFVLDHGAVMSGNVGNLPNVENLDMQYAQSAILTPCDLPFARDGIAAET